jgi:tetratricopeptide (TPR) repeat protein
MQLWLNIAMVMLLCLSGCTLNEKAISSVSATANHQLSGAELSRIASFQEPLVVIGATPTDAENKQLAQALASYHSKSSSERDKLEDVEAFLKAHPQSGWTAALRFNLGVIYHQTGHFSLSLESFREAWKLSASVQDSKGKALADRALGELAISEAYLGHYDELAQLIDIARKRNLQGAATELIACAADGLGRMNKQPETSFLCGPNAIARIYRMTHKGGDKEKKILAAARCTKKGTSLQQVSNLAKRVGLDYQMAYRSRGAPILSPCVVHWKVGHFASLTPSPDGRYRVEDSTDGTFGDGILASQATIDAEASGYFLVPAGKLPAGWRALKSGEGDSVWGRGNPADRKTRGATTTNDPTAKKNGPCPIPMTTWDVHLMQVSLQLEDTPVGLSPAAFSVPFQVTYCQREIGQPANFSYSNFGPKWSSSGTYSKPVCKYWRFIQLGIKSYHSRYVLWSGRLHRESGV